MAFPKAEVGRNNLYLDKFNVAAAGWWKPYLVCGFEGPLVHGYCVPGLDKGLKEEAQFRVSLWMFSLLFDCTNFQWLM